MTCDPHNTIAKTLRGRIRTALLSQNQNKSSSTEELIGCTIEDARAYIESQFSEGMTWGNHGQWHIDHRRPCATFDLVDEDEQKKCFHYTNLQPLWATENLGKGASFDAESFGWEWTGEMWSIK